MEKIFINIDKTRGNLLQRGVIFPGDIREVVLQGCEASAPILILFQRRKEDLIPIVKSSTDTEGKMILNLRTMALRDCFEYSQRTAPNATISLEAFLIDSNGSSLTDEGALILEGTPNVIAEGVMVIKWAPFNYETDGRLVTLKGETGVSGKSAYEIAVANGYVGSIAQWLQSLKGKDGEEGKSAYDIALSQGFAGSKQQWLESLKGEKLEFSDLTQNERDSLKLRFSALTNEEKEELRGPQGNPGEQGPRTLISVDSAEAISSDQDPRVENVGNNENVKLKFYIPKGKIPGFKVWKTYTNEPGKGSKVDTFVDDSGDVNFIFYIPQGASGKSLTYASLTEEQKAELSLTWDKLTAAQKAELSLTWDKMTSEQRDAITLTWDKLTEAQKQSLTLTWDKLTEEQKAELKGDGVTVDQAADIAKIAGIESSLAKFCLGDLINTEFSLDIVDSYYGTIPYVFYVWVGTDSTGYKFRAKRKVNGRVYDYPTDSSGQFGSWGIYVKHLGDEVYAFTRYAKYGDSGYELIFKVRCDPNNGYFNDIIDNYGYTIKRKDIVDNTIANRAKKATDSDKLGGSSLGEVIAAARQGMSSGDGSGAALSPDLATAGLAADSKKVGEALALKLGLQDKAANSDKLNGKTLAEVIAQAQEGMSSDSGFDEKLAASQYLKSASHNQSTYYNTFNFKGRNGGADTSLSFSVPRIFIRSALTNFDAEANRLTLIKQDGGYYNFSVPNDVGLNKKWYQVGNSGGLGNRVIRVVDDESLDSNIILPDIPSNGTIIDTELWIISGSDTQPSVKFNKRVKTRDGEGIELVNNAVNVIHLTAISGQSYYIAAHAAFTTEDAGGDNPFSLDADGNVVVDDSNVGDEGTVEVEAEVGDDGTVEYDL